MSPKKVPYQMRMERALMERLQAEAIRSDRSLNKEVVHRLRLSLEAQDATQETAA
jgi:hypothetical protein